MRMKSDDASESADKRLADIFFDELRAAHAVKLRSSCDHSSLTDCGPACLPRGLGYNPESDIATARAINSLQKAIEDGFRKLRKRVRHLEELTSGIEDDPRTEGA